MFLLLIVNIVVYKRKFFSCVFIKLKMLTEAQIDYKRDPKRLVPVHLSDFMDLAKAITEVDLNRVYQPFNPKYLRGSTSKDCIIQYDNKKCVSIHVLDH